MNAQTERMPLTAAAVTVNVPAEIAYQMLTQYQRATRDARDAAYRAIRAAKEVTRSLESGHTMVGTNDTIDFASIALAANDGARMLHMVGFTPDQIRRVGQADGNPFDLLREAGLDTR